MNQPSSHNVNTKEIVKKKEYYKDQSPIKQPLVSIAKYENPLVIVPNYWLFNFTLILEGLIFST